MSLWIKNTSLNLWIVMLIAVILSSNMWFRALEELVARGNSMGFQINRPLVRSLVVEIILLKNEKKKKILALIFLTMFDQYIEFTFSRTRIKVLK